MFSENVGRDSPAALLDMLAEVASQTLHSEKEQSELAIKGKSKRKYNSLNRKNQDFTFTVFQLLSMPATQLVKQFSIFTSDELKRQYSYVCALMPGCEQKYTSFASEERARMSIKAHLEDHLEVLKSNKETCKKQIVFRIIFIITFINEKTKRFFRKNYNHFKVK